VVDQLQHPSTVQQASAPSATGSSARRARLTRAERVTLAAAALRGMVSGVLHAVASWAIRTISSNS
jgi:hypothetical protein